MAATGGVLLAHGEGISSALKAMAIALESRANVGTVIKLHVPVAAGDEEGGP